MIKLITAGESHGSQLTGIIEGIPANLVFDEDFINEELRRRQIGYGRSERMKIEKDKINILSGVNNGLTTGSPIALSINNKARNIPLEEVINPRPGHGDLVGALKYNQLGGRNILERASARETAMRVGLGAICKLFLREFGIEIYSHVIEIGNIKNNFGYYNGAEIQDFKKVDYSDFRVIDKNFESRIYKEIKDAENNGDSLGGSIEIIVKNVPIGLGSHTSWEDKLDGKLAYLIMSIQGIKSVEIGLGSKSASVKGSNFHDEISYSKEIGYIRNTNHAGGIEAGISNGEDIVIKATMKPIPTLKRGLSTINMKSKESVRTKYERSDVCAVPSASIVCESVVAHVLAGEILKLLGGNFMEEIKSRYIEYNDYLIKR